MRLKKEKAVIVYKHVDDVVARIIAGEKLIVPIRGHLADMRNIFTVDPVGAFIWDSIDGARTLADLRDRITAEFDVADDVAEKDLLEFMAQLKASGLVMEVGC